MLEELDVFFISVPIGFKFQYRDHTNIKRVYFCILHTPLLKLDTQIYFIDQQKLLDLCVISSLYRL